MKTVTITADSNELNALLEEAVDEDVVVRAKDGKEFLLSAIDEFDVEAFATSRNVRLMSLLNERSKQTNTVSLGEVRRQLDDCRASFQTE